MPVSIACPNPACARVSRAPDDALGKRVKCPGCGIPFVATASATGSRASVTSDGRGDATHPPGAATAPPPGAGPLGAIGRFVVREKLGAGAFGAVYRAYDPQLDREVALKVPHQAVLSSPKRVERFLREARAAAGLRHPHIVPVYDAGKDGAQYYIASAFIEGRKLADAVEDAAEAGEVGLPFERAARLVRELAEALAYAHEQGIVHRDVKPDNVMLDGSDHVHLMDFGLAARQDEEESRLTSDGAVMGTPAYMAPEQAAGNTTEVGPAADQYAAGIVLYELLTGKVPFAGPVPLVIHSQINADPEPPSKARAGVPRDLETICLKALSKRPQDRYASCRALADDLRRWLDGEPIAARQAGRFERAVRWVRKNPAGAGLYAAGVVGAVLAVVAIGLAGLARTAVVARDQAERSEAEAVAARDALAGQKREVEEARDSLAAQKREVENARDGEARQRKVAEDARDQLAKLQRQTAASRDDALRLKDEAHAARRQAELATASEKSLRLQVEKEREKVANIEYARTIQLAYSEVLDANIPAAVSLLDSTQPAQRGWEWRYVASLSDSSDATLSVAPPTDRIMVSATYGRPCSFNADGSRAAVSLPSGIFRVWDIRRGAIIKEFGVGQLVTNEFAYLICISNSGNYVLTSQRVSDQPGMPNRTVFRVWDVTTGKEVCKAESSGINAVHAACIFSHDEKHIYVTERVQLPSGPSQQTRSVDMKTGEESVKWKEAQVFSEIAYAHKGGVMAARTSKNNIVIADSKTGEILNIISPPVDTSKIDLRIGAIDSAGNRLAIVGNEFSVTSHTVIVMDAKPRGKDTTAGAAKAQGKDKPVEIRLSGVPLALAFSPDAKLLAADVGSNVRVWDATSGVEVVTLSGHTGPVHTLAFSADGRTLVSAGADGKIRNWDLGLRLNGRRPMVPKANGSIATAGSAVSKFDPPTLNAGSRSVISVSYNFDGTRILTACWNGEVRIWNAENRKELIAIDTAGNKQLESAVFHPDGSSVITAWEDGVVRVYDAQTGRETLSFMTGSSGDVYAAFSPDGKRIATLGRSSPGTIRDAKTGDKLFDLPNFGSLNRSVIAFHPKQPRLLFGGSRSHYVNIETGKLEGDLQAAIGVRRFVRFSADGDQFISADEYQSTASIWTSDGRPIAELRTGREVKEAQFSADGSRVLTAANQSIQIWHAKSGTELLKITLPNCWIHSAAFSPDGNCIVAGCSDGKVRIWDTRRKREVKQPAPKK